MNYLFVVIWLNTETLTYWKLEEFYFIGGTMLKNFELFSVHIAIF